MHQNSSMVITYLGIGFCTCLLFLVINPRLESYLNKGPLTVSTNTDSIMKTANETFSKDFELNSYYRGKKKNVLFIIVDDLRPQLGAYADPDTPDYFGTSVMSTPNLDRLAAQSLLLRRAYVQLPLCGPSRASMLTSRRPDTTRAYGNNLYWRTVGGNFTTLPQLFKENGYISLGFGKVFHTGASSNNDDRISWSEKFYKPPFSDKHYLPKSNGAGWVAVKREDRDFVPLTDDSTVKAAIHSMEQLGPRAAIAEQPFFIAVGFRKPHLSYVCPEEFFSLYPLEKGDQYLADRTWQNPVVRKTCEMGHTTNVDGQKVIADDTLRHLRRAYSACVSYTDYNVGLLLDALTNLGLSNSTVVSFVSDHGYHLGENSHWGKMETFEFSTRVPLMLRIPGVTDHGISSDSLVEAVDLYPTLAEAAGLRPVPKCPLWSSDIEVCTQGRSLLPLIENPQLELRDAAFSQVTSPDQPLNSKYTIRTPRYRYVEKAGTSKEELPDSRYKYKVVWDIEGDAVELYDHDLDPYERFNVVDDPRYTATKAALRQKLHEFADEMHVETKRL